MHTLVFFSAAVAAVSAGFFESPDNPHAAAFYKIPIQRDFSSPNPVYSHHRSSQAFRPQQSYNQGPSSQPSYGGPSNFHQPSYGGPSSFQQPSYSGPSHQSSYGGPSNSGYNGQGARSFQTVRLGGSGHQGYNRPHY